MIFSKKPKRNEELERVRSQVDSLETRVDKITSVLIANTNDPWALAILRTIHTK